MVKQFLIVALMVITINGYSQTKNIKLNKLGISIPIIWNHSEATYYSLGNRKIPTGKGTSYGININYSSSIYKNLFGIVGIGYFMQKFNIIRPFDYDSPTNFGFSTKSYKYNNAHLYAGLGYNLHIAKVFSINGGITFNQFYSFRQKYINQSPVSPQVNHKSLSIGRAFNINIGAERNLTRRISFGIDALIPFSTHWNNDKIFYNLGYSNDEQQIARNKFSMGTSISCKYNF